MCKALLVKAIKHANKALYIFIKILFFHEKISYNGLKKGESNEDFRNFSGFNSYNYMHAPWNASTDDAVVLTMTGSEDKVETLNVVYKGIELGTYTNDHFKTDAYDDIELEISETINYGDLYLWMACKIKWFTC